VTREFEDYLRRGILAHRFTQARCGGYGLELLVPSSCKGSGVPKLRGPTDAGRTGMFTVIQRSGGRIPVKKGRRLASGPESP